MRIPTAALDLQLVAAGLGVHVAVTRLGSWIRRRHEAWPGWFGVSGLAIATVLAANVVVLRQPGEAVLLVRSVALAAAPLALLASIGAITGARLPRHAQPVLVALIVGRLALWVGTDLVYAHRIEDGLPQYGPLVGWTAVPVLALLLAQATVLAGRVAQPFERLTLLAGTGAAAVVATATLAVGDPALAELLTGCWTIPQLAVLQLVLAHRRTAEIDRRRRHHEGTVALARLGEVALLEHDVRSIVAQATGAIEHVVGRPCRLVLGDDGAGRAGRAWVRVVRGHDGPIGRLEVEGPPGDDIDASFVETVAQLLAAWVDRAAAAQDAEHRAVHDDLTSLPNRARLRASLDRALADGAAAVVLLDLDGFKDVNDALGHAAGDAVLVAVAERLVTAADGSATICRFGGDEFVVLCEGAVGEQAVRTLATSLLAALTEPVGCGAAAVTLTACAGVVVSRPGDTAESLLRDAGTAMYRAKELGPGSLAVFDPALRRQHLRRIDTRAALGRAATLGEVEVHYQPVVDLRSLAPTGVEALARWRREGELVGPEEWIELAESSGAIVEIGRQVLGQACRDALLLPAPLGVAVNVSARQLEPDFADVVDDALRCGLDPRRLTLELTESALVEDPTVVRDLLLRLRRRGVQVAVDDFGTGFSSLGQLASLPIDVLKIDRCFVERVSSIDGEAIAATIVALAEALRLDVVAEGVETEEQVLLLREMGCTSGQGFLFARPAPIAEHLGALQRCAS